MVTMHRAIHLLRKVREALFNAPVVGEVYDQQHSDTHTDAILDIEQFLQYAGHEVDT